MVVMYIATVAHGETCARFQQYGPRPVFGIIDILIYPGYGVSYIVHFPGAVVHDLKVRWIGID